MNKSYLASQQPSTSGLPQPVAQRSPVLRYAYPADSRKRRAHFEISRNSAFKEWQEMKQQLTLLQNYILQIVHNQAATVGTPPVVSMANSFNQAAARKRSAPMPPQPECPVALRPTPSSSLLNLPNSFIPWWPLNNMRPTSPTIPTVEPTVTVTTEHVTEQKWGSPSSVDSNGQKTDSTGGESTNIDIVGDGSESTSSSTSTQAMVSTTPERQQQNFSGQIKDSVAYMMMNNKPDFCSSAFNYKMTKPEMPISTTMAMHSTMGTSERKPRKQVSDDYVKVIRSQDLSDERISKIQIPVADAIMADPGFRPVSEQQIIQQIVQNKKFEETQIKDSMVSLCKKLAEKRVFGAKLMSQTTVAGLNHSNYSNLPIEGIIYIHSVCKKVMGDKFANEEDYWDAFRDATKKLAARCRRVRHAKKSKSKYEDNSEMTDEKPECSVSNNIMSMLHQDRKRPLGEKEHTAIESLTSLSNPDAVSLLSGLPDFQRPNPLLSLASHPSWFLMTQAAKQPKTETFQPNEMEPISP